MVLLSIRREYTLFLQRRFKYLITSLLAVITSNSFAQKSVKEFKRESISHHVCNSKQLTNKLIPEEYKEEVSLALLYYPELEKTKIKFRIKKKPSPLTARPSIFAVFRKASKRKYIITISNRVESKFSSILLSNLSFNSQIGVIGHELGHIADYNERYGIYFLKLLFMHLNKKEMDRFECNTDMRCIKHGLGYQLLSWSKEVRIKLKLIQWKGIKHLEENGQERYMNPESIMKAINQNEIYK